MRALAALVLLGAVGFGAYHAVANDSKPQERKSDSEDIVTVRAHILSVDEDFITIEWNEDAYEDIGLRGDTVIVRITRYTEITFKGRELDIEDLSPSAYVHVTGRATTRSLLTADEIIVIREPEPADVAAFFRVEVVEEIAPVEATTTEAVVPESTPEPVPEPEPVVPPAPESEEPPTPEELPPQPELVSEPPAAEESAPPPDIPAEEPPPAA